MSLPRFYSSCFTSHCNSPGSILFLDVGLKNPKNPAYFSFFFLHKKSLFTFFFFYPNYSGAENRWQRRLRSAQGRQSGGRRCGAGRHSGRRAGSGHPSSSSPPLPRSFFSPSSPSFGADRYRRRDPGAFPRRPCRQRQRGEPAPPLPIRD